MARCFSPGRFGFVRPELVKFIRPFAAVGALLLLAAAMSGARAGEGANNGVRGGGDDFSIPDAEGSRFDIDTQDVFGFTGGADTNEEGEHQVTLDIISRFGKRRFAPSEDGAGSARDGRGRSRFRDVNSKLSEEYGFTDDLSVEVGLFADARSVNNVPGLANKSFVAFDGAAVEVQYRFLERSRDNPFGLALSVESRYSRIEESGGQGIEGFGSEVTLIFDARLVPDRLWFASNLIFEPGIARSRGTGEVERESTLGWSNALTTRLTDNLLVGGEIRYLRAYDGLFLNRNVGHALFVGPSANYHFTKAAFVTAAFSVQVAGRDKDPALAGRSLDLSHFERYAGRLKFVVEF